MDPLWIWLARIGAVLLAAGAGWSFGRSVPSWEADEAQDEVEPSPWRPRRGCGYPGSGLYSSGGSYFAGFRGTGWGSACAVGALVLAYFAWPRDTATDDGSNFMLLFQPWFWCMVLGAGIGYGAAVFTDKGPVGPLE